MNKVTPFLMFNNQLEAAIEFYTATFGVEHAGVGGLERGSCAGTWGRRSVTSSDSRGRDGSWEGSRCRWRWRNWG